MPQEWNPYPSYPTGELENVSPPVSPTFNRAFHGYEQDVSIPDTYSPFGRRKQTTQFDSGAHAMFMSSNHLSSSSNATTTPQKTLANDNTQSESQSVPNQRICLPKDVARILSLQREVDRLSMLLQHTAPQNRDLVSRKIRALQTQMDPWYVINNSIVVHRADFGRYVGGGYSSSNGVEDIFDSMSIGRG